MAAPPKPKPKPATDPELQPRLEIYKMLVEMADRVSQRRQANNNFYLTVNTAIVAATAYFATVHPTWLPVVAVSAAGVVICAAWRWSITSYKTLNRAKFEVIHEVEKTLPLQAYTQEWDTLTDDGKSERRNAFHQVESIVPWVFAGLHGVQAVGHLPWAALVAWVRTF